MTRFLVIGSLNTREGSDAKRAELVEFVTSLAHEIVRSGHELFIGCLNDLDLLIARTASEALEKQGVDPKTRITSYVQRGCRPVKGFPVPVHESRISDWTTLREGVRVPEQVEAADVAVLIGGGTGTRIAAGWAAMRGKQLLPISCFGGVGQELYRQITDQSSDDAERFSVLCQLPSPTLATEVVGLASRLSSRRVTVAMSFEKNDKLALALDVFKEVCAERGYHCDVVNEMNTNGSIVDAITTNIEESAFVIAELSGAIPNVYFELGYALGQGKTCVLTCLTEPDIEEVKEVKPIKEVEFDVQGLARLEWDDSGVLRKQLVAKLDAMGL